MRLQYYLLISALLTLFACSKEQDRHEPEQPDNEPKTIDQMNALLIGDWKYLGSSTDTPPFFYKATAENSGTISFDKTFRYVEIRKNALLDSGRYRFTDTVLYNNTPGRFLKLESKFAVDKGVSGLYYASIRNDTLSYGGGYGGPMYKRIKAKW